MPIWAGTHRPNYRCGPLRYGARRYTDQRRPLDPDRFDPDRLDPRSPKSETDTIKGIPSKAVAISCLLSIYGSATLPRSDVGDQPDRFSRPAPLPTGPLQLGLVSLTIHSQLVHSLRPAHSRRHRRVSTRTNAREPECMRGPMEKRPPLRAPTRFPLRDSERLGLSREALPEADERALRRLWEETPLSPGFLLFSPASTVRASLQVLLPGAAPERPLQRAPSE